MPGSRARSSIDVPLAQRIFQLSTAYFLRVAGATAVELLLVLGPFLLLAAAMQLVAPWRERWTERLIGRRTLWLTGGWLATALHELGHAGFALLFGHEVTGVKLFDFQGRDGALGRVEHRYDGSSTVQKLGLLAIGLGPVILAVLVLWLATRYLLGIHILAWAPVIGPIGHLSPATAARIALWEVRDTAQLLTRTLRGASFREWTSWAFVYVALIASSAMRLSGSDLRSVARGAWTITWLLALANALTLWTGLHSAALALRGARGAAFCVTVLLGALALQLVLAAGAWTLVQVRDALSGGTRSEAIGAG